MVRKSADRASIAVRDARGAQHKKIKSMKGRADDIKKAHDIMEQVARKGQDDVKSLMQGAQKALESA